MQLICINDTYTKGQLQFYETWNVQFPLKDKLYELREVVRTFNGTGLLVEEIVNPEVPIKGLTGIFYIEPNFSLKRFTTLDGEALIIEELLETMKSEKLYEGLELVTTESEN